MRICVECGEQFDHRSKAKLRAGGLSTHCENCSEETHVRYAGVQNSDGKQAGVTILKFQSQDDRENYLDFWQTNSGLYKSKSCQLGYGLKSTPAVGFKTVAVFEGNTNHKGKAS
jgi:hypothetical protein